VSDEKPSSIWKKEISFRRKAADEAAVAADPGESTSIWKKEISLRKKAKADEPEAAAEPGEAPAPTVPDPAAPEPFTQPADPVLEAAIAALSVPEPLAPAPAPEPAAPVAPAALEHDWLTKPLEEISEPPAEPVAPAEPVPPAEPVAPVSYIPVAPVPVAPVQVDPSPFEPVPAEPVALAPEPAPVVELVPAAPEPVLDLDLELPDVPEVAAEAPTVVLPELPPEPQPEPAVEPVAPEPSAKVPFYKKELSFKRGPREPKAPKAPKAEKPRREKKVKAAAEGEAKPPFYKRDLSFKRKAKEWDPGEGTVEAPAPKPARSRPSLSLPTVALPTLSRGGGTKGRVVGLKIGGSQIAAARIHNGEAPELVQAARAGLDHGIVVNGELRDPEALAVALKDFFARHKLPKRGVRLGIANNRIGVRTFEVTGIDDPKQLANAIRFRAQEVLPIPLEEAVLDYQVLGEGTSEDGQPTRRVLLVVAYRELVDRYVYACRKAGLQIVGIDLEAFALLRAVAPPHDPFVGSERGALVAVSVGHDRSTFAVSDGRVCEFTRVLEWGGWALNVAIARALDLSPGEVEPLKRALSFAGADTAPEGFTAEQLDTAREAARRQLQTFARELVSSLQFYQNQPGSLGIGEIAITGGTAHLPGLGAELERLIGVPVRVVDPLSRLKVSKKARDHEQVGSLAVAIGLGIED
jgi:type IV pilus assembly protein PilM